MPIPRADNARLPAQIPHTILMKLQELVCLFALMATTPTLTQEPASKIALMGDLTTVLGIFVWMIAQNPTTVMQITQRMFV